MARQSLGALLGNVDDTAAHTADSTTVGPSAGTTAELTLAPERAPVATQKNPTATMPARVQATPRHAPVSAPVAVAGPTELPTELPAYLRLVRKETRLRDDQQNALTLHARRLNRTKTPGTPRVTDNTLIRVAVDLLLARIERATGGDEAAILESLNS